MDADEVCKSKCRKYAVKVFESYEDSGYVFDVPLTDDGAADEDAVREEVHSFVFERLDIANNIPFEYTVHSGTDNDEIWLMVGKVRDNAVTIQNQLLKDTIDDMSRKHASKVKSLESKIEAELLAKAVEFEEKEIALQKEVITVRLKHAKDTADLRNRVSEYEERIKQLESKLALLEK